MRGSDSRTRTRRPLVVLATLVAMLAASPEAAQATIRSREQTFAAMVNDTRALSLLNRLELQDNLCDIARRHSRRMAERGRLFHSKLERLLGNGRTSVAENVAYGGTLDSALKGFLGSPPHLENILGDYTMTGVGIVRRDGYLWITQIFAA
ncbi:MAG: CAP domain-containing protein [Actinomycetota bacterium]